MIAPRTFLQFMAAEIGPRWTIGRRTPRMLERYPEHVIITSNAYNALERRHAQEVADRLGSNPVEVVRLFLAQSQETTDGTGGKHRISPDRGYWIALERIASGPDVHKAARALIDSYGGDVPSWIKAEVEALEDAIEPWSPDPWHVGELSGDDGRTIRDENGLTVKVCATAEQAAAEVAQHNGEE